MKQKVGYFLMEIEFLGTGAGSPAKFRNVSSLALKLLDESNEIWLFDVGEGTQHQILNSTIRPRKVDRIFITHLHGDHLFGLPGFLSSRSFQGAEQMGPLNIYGPKGIKDYVMNSLHISQTKLTYKIIFNELSDEGLIFEDDCFKVYARFLDHRITCFGYRVVEKDRPGTLKVDKLIAEHVPSGPIYGQLKSGKTIKLPDGRILNGLDYIGEPKKGRIVTILGDTRQTDSIAKLAKDADVLVHESTFSKNEGRLAYNYYHSTNVQAAKIARDNNVKQLYLNHISARYVGQMVKDLQKDACKVFKNTRVVRDFDIYEVPQPNTKD